MLMEAPVAYEVGGIIVYMPVFRESTYFRASVIEAVVAEVIPAIRIVMFVVNRHDRIIFAP